MRPQSDHIFLQFEVASGVAYHPILFVVDQRFYCSRFLQCLTECTLLDAFDKVFAGLAIWDRPAIPASHVDISVNYNRLFPTRVSL